VDQTTLNTIKAAEKAVTRLVEVCRKDGTLYPRAPRVVAHVNRTSKWLLNALAVLQRELNTSPPEDDRQGT
jgi:hypothetical protein